ncbi:hypothetical protein J8F10_09390 [Gemmata sp. G18]|uniref:Uncharacterized protein n=1 Tax=Gemmata palustris TaxID=2822762 RepID=A0ABS5BP37_9BACT|nr:hypothetical protein [Gemmata palustris]MBP3955494.1 hypothetical protein [Gemmata palustris]
MLFAAVTLFAAGIDVNSRDYKNAQMFGALTAGAVCGLWPLLSGFSKGRPILGIIGFFTCIPSAVFLGCLLSLPVAFVFKLLIGAMGSPKPPRKDDFPDEPFNPYANGKRSAF